jgi:hypothetical protein
MSVDTVKQRERAQQIALFRYQLICPALEPGLSTKQRGRIVRAIADRDHDGPFGGGSAATGAAGSRPCPRHPGSPAPGSTPRCSSWPPP